MVIIGSDLVGFRDIFDMLRMILTVHCLLFHTYDSLTDLYNGSTMFSVNYELNVYTYINGVYFILKICLWVRRGIYKDPKNKLPLHKFSNKLHM